MFLIGLWGRVCTTPRTTSLDAFGLPWARNKNEKRMARAVPLTISFQVAPGVSQGSPQHPKKEGVKVTPGHQFETACQMHPQMIPGLLLIEDFLTGQEESILIQEIDRQNWAGAGVRFLKSDSQSKRRVAPQNAAVRPRVLLQIQVACARLTSRCKSS
jgi:hypothetical protein